MRVRRSSDVVVIIHQRKTTDSDCENIRQMRESLFDPVLAAGISHGITEQKRAAHAASDAVAPASDGHTHELSASDCHEL